MNLPNKLTVLRVIMVPFFVFFMLTDVGGAANKWIALALFVIASLTDMLDGKIARKYNLVTNFGKFMDPLADKLLVCSAMICLIPSGKLAPAIVIVIIAREFIISGFRLVASDNGIVIAASYWGKFKTVFQMGDDHRADRGFRRRLRHHRRGPDLGGSGAHDHLPDRLCVEEQAGSHTGRNVILRESFSHKGRGGLIYAGTGIRISPPLLL